MAIRREILLIVALILVIALLLKLVEFFKSDVVGAEASQFVKEDLGTRYPGADIEIMAILQKTNEAGTKYFEVKARVTEDSNSPCPKRTHIFYNYPAQNFIAQLPEVITSECKVCLEGICTIAFPEEAIIASHTFSGTENVSAYLKEYPPALPSASEKTDSWMVKWDGQGAMSYLVVDLHRNGTILSVREIQKS